MQWIMRKLKLDQLTEVEKIEYQEAQALIHHEITERLDKYTERGYIAPNVAARIRSKHAHAYQEACQAVSNLSNEARNNLAVRVLRMFAIGIEKRHLKELYHHNEVTEAVFRRLTGKLQLQLESIESGVLEPDMSLHTDNKDVFERIAAVLRKLFIEETATDRIEHNYMYYRAQTIIARKVLKELVTLQRDTASSIFTASAMAHVTDLYTTFRTESEKKMHAIAIDNPGIALVLSERLAQYGVHKIAETVLEEIRERELVTQKLSIVLADDIAHNRI
jgi:ribosomal protein S20